jgi:alanine-glyoxylate transaminase/serine-glyoxylate transaminase/serine-pyruvate transaminase
MIYGLYEALHLILEEGLNEVFKRHMDNHRLLVTGLGEIGLEMLVDKPYRLPMLNSVLVPDGLDEARVRQELLTKYKIEIGAGLGPLAGKIFRIGLMGHTSRPENVQRLLEALKEVI